MHLCSEIPPRIVEPKVAELAGSSARGAEGPKPRSGTGCDFWYDRRRDTRCVSQMPF